MRLANLLQQAMSGIRLLSQEEAIRLDQDLFNKCLFSVDQLMELAGLAVASSIYKTYPSHSYKTIAICSGPGNNGGDGLVAARHLKGFGYRPSVYYPKPGKLELYERLVNQCKEDGIPFLNTIDDIEKHSLIVDAIFGFSFKPPCRPEYFQLLSLLSTCQNRLISIDIPSGWHVENGPPTDDTPLLKPDCLISLTAPKVSAKHFTGRYHWLGGRFVPNSLKQKYNLNLPDYPANEQCVKIL